MVTFSKYKEMYILNMPPWASRYAAPKRTHTVAGVRYPDYLKAAKEIAEGEIALVKQV